MNLNALLDPLAIGVLFLTAVLFPLTGVWEFRRLVRWNVEMLPDARVRHYRWIVASEWISVAVFLSWWFWSGRQAAPLGLVPDPSGWQWLAVAVGFVLSTMLVLQMVSATRNPKSLEGRSEKAGHAADMIPRNPRELRAFDQLSITAGICEEILYRGLVFVILTAAIGIWPAVFVSSALFGLAHIYQGLFGFMKTAVLGLVLALLTVFTGSLFMAIIFHVTMDLTSGRIMVAAYALPAEDSASEPY